MQQQKNEPLPRVCPSGKDAQVVTSLDDQRNLSSIKYKKLTLNNYNKINCKCCTCDIIKNFSVEYYNNPSILMDNDWQVHIFKTVE